MLIALLLGIATIAVSMGIQVLAVVVMVRQITHYQANNEINGAFRIDAVILSIVLTVMFAGHILQIAIWALLFVFLQEFTDFATAFYHSTVNFASLGYGDIVMSEKWRLLGALEASNGVLMFGLTAGTLLTVMTRLFSRHKGRIEAMKAGKD